MDYRLEVLTNLFRCKGLIARHIQGIYRLRLASGRLEDERIELKFPKYPDFEVNIGAVGNALFCEVWQSYTGKTIGTFWTTDLDELLLLALLKIVPFEAY